jgi:hypothetical protein
MLEKAGNSICVVRVKVVIRSIILCAFRYACVVQLRVELETVNEPRGGLGFRGVFDLRLPLRG